MSYKVFIDGQEGTTGLKIFERFQDRTDVELLQIDPSLRKDLSERKRLINESDYTFLCLPDNAAREAVTLLENPNTKIIDASTAHRTHPDWVYGLPELSKQQREKIRNADKVAVPGCYASGFISLVAPLVMHNVISPDYPITCHAVSGYSGAGKKAIAVYESENKPYEYNSPRQYALGQQHKHQKEMQTIAGLSFPPMFNPIVDNFYSGMVVSVPILSRLTNKHYTAKQIHEILSEHYWNEHFIKVEPFMGEGVLQDGFLAANTLSGTNMMQIFVCGNDEQILLAARLDNLGKGASGAAIQCMNIMMGIDETIGLE
jgi:N-acetyl-gamma-glutamyl-phosphate reductase